MRNNISKYLAAGIIIALSLLILPAYAATIVGTITDTTNTVQYQKAGGTKWLEAESGTKLYNNDKIRTLANSKATLTLDDGKNIHIPQRTTMTVTADSNKVTLDIGKGIYKFVKGKDVKPSPAPVATAGVMGWQDKDDTAGSSEEVLQVENPDGNIMSLKGDGSVVDPSATSNLNSNTTGSTGNSTGKVNPNSAKEDVKSGVNEIQQDVQNDVQNKVKDKVKEDVLKGLFGK